MFQMVKIYNYSIQDLFNSCSIYIMPMVNPDGVNLVTGNKIKILGVYRNCFNIASNFPNIPFPSGWKANIKGVDFKNYQPISQSIVTTRITLLCVFDYLHLLFLQFL